MKFKCFLLVALLSLTPGLLYAGSGCGTPTIVPADGRVVDFDFVAPSTSNFYQFNVTNGDSYSVEVRQDYDDLQSPNPDITTSAFTDAGTCAAPLGSTTTTTAVDPALPGNSQRFSFTAAATGTVTLKATNSNVATGRYLSVSVSDTTQYNVRWSTFAGFITQWGFQNTTNQVIHAQLIATTTLGTAVAPASTGVFAIPANNQVFKIIAASGGDLNVGATHAGFAVITTDAPPGGLLLDSFFISNTSPIVIVPSVIQPVRQGHSGR